jgi:hypothetical protein
MNQFLKARFTSGDRRRRLRGRRLRGSVVHEGVNSQEGSAERGGNTNEDAQAHQCIRNSAGPIGTRRNCGECYSVCNGIETLAVDTDVAVDMDNQFDDTKDSDTTRHDVSIQSGGEDHTRKWQC